MLTALFLLNIVTFVGFSLYLWDKDTKTARYVLQMQADMKELRVEAMRAASKCNQQRYPLPSMAVQPQPPVPHPPPPYRPK